MEKQRKYLPVSWVSTLGICETQLADKIAGKVHETQQMRVGTAGHEYLYQKSQPMTKEEILAGMRSGRRFEAREVWVFDSVIRIDGKIDCLSLSGEMNNERNRGIIVDDKYPGSLAKNGLSLYRKLQLASYAVALSNSSDFGSVCEIIGARIKEREADTNAELRTLSVDIEQLSIWKGNVGTAAKAAWSLYKKVNEAEHRQFNVELGAWQNCRCTTIVNTM